MPKYRYSDTTIDEAARLREQGKSYAAIAERLGMTVKSVEYHCLRLGALSPHSRVVSARPGMVSLRRGQPVRRFTAAEDRKLLQMERSGASLIEMARALGRRNHTISARLMTLARHEALLELQQEIAA